MEWIRGSVTWHRVTWTDRALGDMAMVARIEDIIEIVHAKLCRVVMDKYPHYYVIIK